MALTRILPGPHIVQMTLTLKEARALRALLQRVRGTGSQAETLRHLDDSLAWAGIGFVDDENTTRGTVRFV